MTPEIVKHLIEWNRDRIELDGVDAGLAVLQARKETLESRMSATERLVEQSVDELDEPIGLKIGDDYVAIIDCDPYIIIRVINFKTPEEILDVQR